MVGEAALVAWELRESLPEFEARPPEEQDWLMATYRIRKKLDATALAESAK